MTKKLHFKSSWLRKAFSWTMLETIEMIANDCQGMLKVTF